LYEVLIFIFIVYLMKQFQDTVKDLAYNIYNSYVYAHTAAQSAQNWMKGQKASIKKSAIEKAKNVTTASKYRGGGGPQAGRRGGGPSG